MLPDEFKTAYLFTAARFAGFAFNPLSLWYLYTPAKSLGAIILEVNNTFEERRLYFLRAPVGLEGHGRQSIRFKSTWEKDFYVSPLNPREGTYSVVTTDPFSGDALQLDATITLSSTEGQTKLIARIVSDSPALDPARMSVRQKVAFLTRWWWVGFATFHIRTIYQALLLNVRLGLPWFHRPEPKATTVPRLATGYELAVEERILEYLDWLSNNAEEQFGIVYHSTGLRHGERITIGTTRAETPESFCTMDIRILTPQFFSDVHDHSCLSTALKQADSTSKTVEMRCSVSCIDVLARQEYRFLSSASPGLHRHERLFARAIQLLRRSSAEDTSDHPIKVSPFDTFVFIYSTWKFKGNYALTLLKHVSLPAILHGINIAHITLFLLRLASTWWLVGTLMRSTIFHHVFPDEAMTHKPLS